MSTKKSYDDDISFDWICDFCGYTGMGEEPLICPECKHKTDMYD